MDCAVNIISGSDGANGGIPGAGIYEPDEVMLVMIPYIMIMTFLIKATGGINIIATARKTSKTV